jgi:hypothetical protein
VTPSHFTIKLFLCSFQFTTMVDQYAQAMVSSKDILDQTRDFACYNSEDDSSSDYEREAPYLKFEDVVAEADDAIEA